MIPHQLPTCEHRQLRLKAKPKTPLPEIEHGAPVMIQNLYVKILVNKRYMGRNPETGDLLVLTTRFSVSLTPVCPNRAVQCREIEDCVLYLTALRFECDKTGQSAQSIYNEMLIQKGEHLLAVAVLMLSRCTKVTEWLPFAPEQTHT